MEQLITDYQNLKESAELLVKKLEEIHEDSGYKGIWTSAMIHGIIYRGPTYKNELDNLKEILKSSEKY